MPTRSTPLHRWRLPLALGAAVAVAVLVVVAGPAVVAGTSVGRAALGSTGCAAADPTVGLVIDFGDKLYSSDPPALAKQCLAPTDTGLKLLLAGGHTFRLDDHSGLLCAIDHYPDDTSCGVHNADGTYDFWSYWTGTGSTWTYAPFGPATHEPTPGGADGWHFVRGHANPSDPPPGVDPSAPCDPPPSPTTTTSTTTPGPGGPGGGGSGPGGGGQGHAPAFHVTPTIPAGSSGQTTSPSDVTNDTIRGQALTEAESATSLDGEGFDTVPEGTDPGSRNELASGEPGSPDGGSSSGSGIPIAVVGGGVVIVALGAVAVLRLRTKPED